MTGFEPTSVASVIAPDTLNDDSVVLESCATSALTLVKYTSLPCKVNVLHEKPVSCGCGASVANVSGVSAYK